MTQLAIDNPTICWVLRESRGTDLGGPMTDRGALSSSPGGTFASSDTARRSEPMLRLFREVLRNAP